MPQVCVRFQSRSVIEKETARGDGGKRRQRGHELTMHQLLPRVTYARPARMHKSTRETSSSSRSYSRAPSSSSRVSIRARARTRLHITYATARVLLPPFSYLVRVTTAEREVAGRRRNARRNAKLNSTRNDARQTVRTVVFFSLLLSSAFSSFPFLLSFSFISFLYSSAPPLFPTTDGDGDDDDEDDRVSRRPYHCSTAINTQQWTRTNKLGAFPDVDARSLARDLSPSIPTRLK
ncbi:hypothetical protein PUN28_000959 [Cardiocondyla obscurior]|uniref:Transmembrane protein n=1 Tax=Cardiocondyla obscurior TaxID=286306 RepID=A0AAW2H226_9HYME